MSEHLTTQQRVELNLWLLGRGYESVAEWALDSDYTLIFIDEHGQELDQEAIRVNAYFAMEAALEAERKP